jgi:3-oxoacyl-[acyl-carrier-protein] synthase-3
VVNELKGIDVRGIVAAVPSTVARIDDYEQLSEPERRKFTAATGIRERRIASLDQCSSDLCHAAAGRLLELTGWAAHEVDLLVLITQTGDYPIPATSILLQHRLGLPTKTICFDVNLGCSSYPHGLAIVGSMLKALGLRKALLLIGDVSSKLCRYEDKATWPLFGDAGSATALESLDGSSSSMTFDFNSDGTGKDAIIIPSGGLASRCPTDIRDLAADSAKKGYMTLAGADVFSFAISEVPPSILRCLGRSGLTPASVDHVVLHQANKMINDMILRKTGFGREKALSSLESFGNTSSVSIPLTVCVNRAAFGGGPKTLLVSGFGVGLSWASCVLQFPEGIHLDLIEAPDHDRGA